MNVQANFFLEAINPFSGKLFQSAKEFESLHTRHKIITVSVAIFAGLATLFAGGIGGLFMFSFLVEEFKKKKAEPVKTEKDIQKTVEEILSIRVPDVVQEEKITVPAKMTLEQLMAVKKPWKVPSKVLGISPEEAKACNLSFSDEPKAIQDAFKGKIQEIIYSLATKKFVEYPEIYIERMRVKLLNHLPKKPICPLMFIQFVKLAALYLTDLNVFPLYAWSVLERLEWPSEALKKEQLSEIILQLDGSAGCKILEWKSFLDEEGRYQQHFELIDPKNLFKH